MKAVGPAATRHQAAGELVDDDDFRALGTVFDDILHVAAVEGVGFDGGLDVVFEIPVLNVGDVADAEQLLDLLPTLIA